jgi:hypothetical protein
MTPGPADELATGGAFCPGTSCCRTCLGLDGGPAGPIVVGQNAGCKLAFYRSNPTVVPIEVRPRDASGAALAPLSRRSRPALQKQGSQRKAHERAVLPSSQGPDGSGSGSVIDLCSCGKPGPSLKASPRLRPLRPCGRPDIVTPPFEIDIAGGPWSGTPTPGSSGHVQGCFVTVNWPSQSGASFAAGGRGTFLYVFGTPLSF